MAAARRAADAARLLGRRLLPALLSRPPCRRPDRTVTWDRPGAGRRAGGNPTAWAVVISIRGFVVDLVTPMPGGGGRGYDRRVCWAMPDGRQPHTRSGAAADGRRGAGSSAWGLWSSCSAGCGESPRESWSKPQPIAPILPAARSGHDPRRGPHGTRPGSASRMAFGRRCDLDLSRSAGPAPAASLLRRAAPDRCCTPTRAVASHLGACRCRACRTASCAGHRPGLLSIRPLSRRYGPGGGS
jgi:hypothetical protein